LVSLSTPNRVAKVGFIIAFISKIIIYSYIYMAPKKRDLKIAEGNTIPSAIPPKKQPLQLKN